MIKTIVVIILLTLGLALFHPEPIDIKGFVLTPDFTPTSYAVCTNCSDLIDDYNVSINIQKTNQSPSS